jgi:class 3 adenylate cyclase
MAADEMGRLQRLAALRQKMLEPLIASHRGLLAKLMDDGLLVEFPNRAE